MEIQYKELKSVNIRYSGRSSDYLFPTLCQGCVGQCLYCYASRHTEEFRGKIKISTNIDKILNIVRNFDCRDVVKPNQTHEKYVTWDIGCNSDISIDINHFDYEKLFDYFKYSDRDFATFATKFVNLKLYKYNANKKIRIRPSLTTKYLSETVEKHTSDIECRIKSINNLYEAGYEVHLNFSPVIVYDGWQNQYLELFQYIDKNISNEVKKDLKCEVIFLTHNKKLHERNINTFGEGLLWKPEIQEYKISSFGGENIRYKHELKAEYIKEFKHLLNKEMPYCEIRYIF